MTLGASRRGLAVLLFLSMASIGNVYAIPEQVGSDRIFGDAFEVPPVADFDTSALGPEVTFTDLSTDAVGTVSGWSWDFGDGSTATGQNPVHTFSAAGTYTVTETAINDANGESGVVSKSVTVAPCGTLTAYLHDFKFAGAPGGHPDFETTYGCGGVAPGLASATMTPGSVPTLASTTASGCGQQISSAASFAQWFVDDPINVPITQTLVLAETSPGNYAYSDSEYFPIDGQGFGNDNVIGLDGNIHNYAFTTALHTQFRFNVGQTIAFTGSNDFWVYIDGRLAIDGGGVHGTVSSSLTLDNPMAAVFGLTPGRVYRLDFFQAQRHTVGSHFNLSTTMCLSDGQ